MNTTEYLVSCLGEEGAEVAQMASKINRFGIDDLYTSIDFLGKESKNPGSKTNRFRLVDELNDLMASIKVLVEAGVIPKDWQSEPAQTDKIKKIHRYLGYAKRVGAVECDQDDDPDHPLNRAFPIKSHKPPITS